MEALDAELQQRVWQRVQGSKPPEDPSPEGLRLEERSDAALLRLLGYKGIAAQCDRRAAVLQGICRLSGIPDATVHPRPERPNAPLRHLMGQLLRRQRAYCSLKTHGEYGCLFERLAQQTVDSCMLLAANMTAPSCTTAGYSL